MLSIYLLLFMFTTYSELTSAYFLFAFSGILLTDGFVIVKFKKDLFGEKYKGTVSSLVFKFCLYMDYIIGIPMMITSIIVAIVSGIGIE